MQRALERRAVLAERPVVDHDGGDAGGGRALQSFGGGLVRDDQRDLGGIILVLRRLDQRHHVGAAAGNEDGDALASHAISPGSQWVQPWPA